MSKRIELVLEVNDKGSAVVQKFTSSTEEKVKQMSGHSEGFIGRLKDMFDNLGGAALTVVQKLGHIILKVAELTAKLGGAAWAAASFAAAFVAKKSLNEFTEFESALTDMGKVTGESMASIKEKILALPAALGSATEMTRGYYAVISAGVTEPQKAMETLQVAAKAAKASHTDLFGTIEGLTKMMAGYEGEIQNVSDASDLLFAMEKEGQTTFQQLIPVIGGVSKLSHDLGINAQEMAGSLSLITQTAGSTSEAATQYRAVLVALMKPTTAMQEALAGMGYDSAQVAIKEIGLAGTLEKLKESTGGSANKMAELFGQQEALMGVSALSANNFGNLEQKINAMGEAAGGTEKAFGSWQGTLAAIKEAFENTIGRQLILIGERLAPAVKAVTERMSEWLETNRELITQEIGVWIKGLVDWAEKFVPYLKDIAGYIYDWYENNKDLIATKLQNFVERVGYYVGELIPLLPDLLAKVTPLINAVSGLAKAFEWLGKGIGWLVAQGVDQVGKSVDFVKSLFAMPDSDLTVNFLGSGSSTKPLGEKVDEMDSLLSDFTEDAGNLTPQLLLDASPVRDQTEMAQDAIGDYVQYMEELDPSISLDIDPAIASVQEAEDMVTDFTEDINGLNPQLYIDTDPAIDTLVSTEDEAASWADKIESLDPELLIDASHAYEQLNNARSQAGQLSNYIENLNPAVNIDIAPAQMALQKLEADYKQRMATLMLGYASAVSSNLSGGYGSAKVISGYREAISAAQSSYIRSQSAIQGMSYIMSYQHGTEYVPETGPYLLHEGERVVPAAQAEQERRESSAQAEQERRESSVSIIRSIETTKNAIYHVVPYIVPKEGPVIPPKRENTEKKFGGNIIINIPQSSTPKRPEDWRRITREYIIPEIEKVGK